MNIEYATLGESPSNSPFNDYDRYVNYVEQNAGRVPDWFIHKYSMTAEIVDLSDNCLTTLVGVDQLIRLRELILDNNGLSEVKVFDDCFSTSLKTLSLNKNQFCELRPLVDSVKITFPRLKFLSLLGNPCCPDQLTRPDVDDQDDYCRYRLFVISQLSFLEFLDSTPVTPQERNRARQIGRFQLVARPHVSNFLPPAEDNIPRGLNPLPAQEGSDRAAKNAFGTLRYRYTGKHSEGNRFIKDTQL